MEGPAGRKKRRIAAMSRKKRVWRRVGLLGTWALAFLAVLMVVVGFGVLSGLQRPEARGHPQKQVATIEFSDGSTLARIGTVDRTIVPLSPGLGPGEVGRAGRRGPQLLLRAGRLDQGHDAGRPVDLTGGSTQGGSGITQQYVKNAYLSSQQTLSRKLKELAIAVKLAREYSKDQILEYYLNTVYFGRGAYGIQAAAQVYFDTTAAKLDTAQAALLAGLLQSPTYYDPAINLPAREGPLELRPGRHGRDQAPRRGTRATAQFPATGRPKAATGSA